MVRSHVLSVLMLVSVSGSLTLALEGVQNSSQVKKYWDLSGIPLLDCSLSDESEARGGYQAVQVRGNKLYVIQKGIPGALAWEVYRIMLPYSEYTENGTTKRIYDKYLIVHAGDGVKSVVELKVKAGVNADGNLSPYLGSGEFRALNREARTKFDQCHL